MKSQIKISFLKVACFWICEWTDRTRERESKAKAQAILLAKFKD